MNTTTEKLPLKHSETSLGKFKELELIHATTGQTESYKACLADLRTFLEKVAEHVTLTRQIMGFTSAPAAVALLPLDEQGARRLEWWETLGRRTFVMFVPTRKSQWCLKPLDSFLASLPSSRR